MCSRQELVSSTEESCLFLSSRLASWMVTCIFTCLAPTALLTPQILNQPQIYSSSTAFTRKNSPSCLGALARTSFWVREAATSSGLVTFCRGIDCAVGGTLVVSTCCNIWKFSRILDSCSLNLSRSASV